MVAGFQVSSLWTLQSGVYNLVLDSSTLTESSMYIRIMQKWWKELLKKTSWPPISSPLDCSLWGKPLSCFKNIQLTLKKPIGKKLRTNMTTRILKKNSHFGNRLCLMDLQVTVDSPKSHEDPEADHPISHWNLNDPQTLLGNRWWLLQSQATFLNISS